MKRFFEVVTFVLALAIVFSALATGALADTIYYQEAQLGWISVGQITVRNQPDTKATSVAKVKNATYVVVLGKVETDQGRFYEVVLLGENEGVRGYVLAKGVSLGVKVQVTMSESTWAYSTPLEQEDGCVAEISGGQTRPVMGEIVTQDGEWWCIQVEENHRGAGFVRKDRVSAPFITPEDQALLERVRTGNYSGYVAPVQQQTAQVQVVTAETPVQSTEQTTTVNASNITANSYAKAIQPTAIMNSPSANAQQVATLNAGDSVYVWQVVGSYAYVIYGQNSDVVYVLAADLTAN